MYAVSTGPWIFLSLDGEHTMELSDDVKKGLIAGAFGLIGTLFPVLLSWSRDRDAASTRQHKIDEATKRVAFWDQWLKLYSQLESPSGETASQRVQKELALLGDIIENDSLIAHTQISRQQEKTSQFTERIISLPAWRRFFLLYRPERSLAWFPRLLFYSGLCPSSCSSQFNSPSPRLVIHPPSEDYSSSSSWPLSGAPSFATSRASSSSPTAHRYP
jgi:hypothetical protein